MKKLFALLLLASAVLSSCSSDNDSFSGGENNTKTEKYPVKFSIKSQGFEVDKTPLKSSSQFDKNSFLQIIAYKQSGEVYLDSIIEPDALKALVTENNLASISINLPKGKYYLSIFNRDLGNEWLKNTTSDLKINSANYNTDYYNKEQDYNNVGQYYYTDSITVSANSSNSNNAVLEPMWSTISEINTKQADDFVMPSGVFATSEQVNPWTYGFGIKSKSSKTLNPFYLKEFGAIGIQLDIIFPTVPFYISKSEETNNLTLEICYFKNDNQGRYRVFKLQKIDLNTQIENGMNYKISGTIPNLGAIATGDMNVTLAPFKDKDYSFK